jgi:hypothetical protein
MPVEVKGHVYHATLKRDALADLLAKRFTASASAIVRRVDEAGFVSFDPNTAASLVEQWSEGQVFGTEDELRWRHVGESCAVLLLTEKAEGQGGTSDFQSVSGSPFAVVSPSSDQKHGLLLWGTRQARGQWWEARIPRPLDYPLKTDQKPPNLTYRLYQDGAAVRWVRLVQLVEVKSK